MQAMSSNTAVKTQDQHEPPTLSRAQRAKRTMIWLFKRTLTFLLSHVGLTLVVVGYVIFGGVLFMAIEKPSELDQREEANRHRKIALDSLVSSIEKARASLPPISSTTSLPRHNITLSIGDSVTTTLSLHRDGNNTFPTLWGDNITRDNFITTFSPELGDKQNNTFPPRVGDDVTVDEVITTLSPQTDDGANVTLLQLLDSNVAVNDVISTLSPETDDDSDETLSPLLDNVTDDDVITTNFPQVRDEGSNTFSPLPVDNVTHITTVSTHQAGDDVTTTWLDSLTLRPKRGGPTTQIAHEGAVVKSDDWNDGFSVRTVSRPGDERGHSHTSTGSLSQGHSGVLEDTVQPYANGLDVEHTISEKRTEDGSAERHGHSHSQGLSHSSRMVGFPSKQNDPVVTRDPARTPEHGTFVPLPSRLHTADGGSLSKERSTLGEHVEKQRKKERGKSQKGSAKTGSSRGLREGHTSREKGKKKRERKQGQMERELQNQPHKRTHAKKKDVKELNKKQHQQSRENRILHDDQGQQQDARSQPHRQQKQKRKAEPQQQYQRGNQPHPRHRQQQQDKKLQQSHKLKQQDPKRNSHPSFLQPADKKGGKQTSTDDREPREKSVLRDLHTSMLDALKTMEKSTYELTTTFSWDGQFEQEDEVQWSFAGAMLYSVTVVTTIGYGHLAPKTTLGRLVTILYAIVGIPLTFLCVRNIGSLLSTIVTGIYRHAFVGLMMRWRLAKARMRRSRRISLIRDIMNDGARRLSSQLSRHWLAIDHRLVRDQELRKSLRRLQKERKKWKRRRGMRDFSEDPSKDGKADAEEEEELGEDDNPAEKEEESKNRAQESSFDDQEGSITKAEKSDTRDRAGNKNRAQWSKDNEQEASKSRAKQNVDGQERNKSTAEQKHSSRNSAACKRGDSGSSVRRVRWRDNSPLWAEHPTSIKNDARLENTLADYSGHGGRPTTNPFISSITEEDDIKFIDDEEENTEDDVGQRKGQKSSNGGNDDNDTSTNLSRKSSKRGSRRSKGRGSSESGGGAEGGDEEERQGESKLNRQRSLSKRRSTKKKKEEFRRSALLEEEEKLRRVFLEEAQALRRSAPKISTSNSSSSLSGSASIANNIHDDKDEVDIVEAECSGGNRRTGLSGLVDPETVTLPSSTPRSRSGERKSRSTSIDDNDTTVTSRKARSTEDAEDSAVEGEEMDEDSVTENDDPLSKPVDTSHVRVPVWVTLLIMTCYILGGAVMFTVWEEDWDFLEGSYFCFITLSTIGFGDFVPGTSIGPIAEEKWIMCCLYLLLGMAMQAMCFHLMQEEVRASFRRLAARCGLLSSVENTVQGGNEKDEGEAGNLDAVAEDSVE